MGGSVSLKSFYLLMIASMVIFSIPKKSFATLAGPYMGGQLGWGNVHQGSYIASYLNGLVNKIVPGTEIDGINVLFQDSGLAGRLFAGYQFNAYFAAEVGYYRFSRLDVNSDMITTLDLKKYGYDIVTVNLFSRASVATDAFDFVAKGIYPVTDRFSIYGKLGLAYMHIEGHATIGARINLAEISISANPTLNVIYPTFGVGVNYDLTQHVSADISWNRIQQYSSRAFPSTDFVGLGVLYHF